MGWIFTRLLAAFVKTLKYCFYCENYQGPLGRDDEKHHKCNTCHFCSNFERKKKMNPRMRYEYYMFFSKEELAKWMVKYQENLGKIEEKLDSVIEQMGGKKDD